MLVQSVGQSEDSYEGLFSATSFELTGELGHGELG